MKQVSVLSVLIAVVWVFLFVKISLTLFNSEAIHRGYDPDPFVNINIYNTYCIAKCDVCSAPTDCNLDLISSSSHRNGTVVSPHYPFVYPAGVQCQITLRPRTDIGERVQLVVIDFDLHYPIGNPRDPHECVNYQSINQYSFNKSMAERKLINNREKRHAKYMLYQKCQYNEMFR